MGDNIEATFYADAVLFDMDDTLIDCTSAVEAAWVKVADDIGQDPAYMIAATRGKRVRDVLSQFKPHIKPHELDAEVQAFDDCVLSLADAYSIHDSSFSVSPVSSGASTPSFAYSMSPGSSRMPSRMSSRMPSRTTSFTGSVASDYFSSCHRPSLLRGASSSSNLIPEESELLDGTKWVEEMDITEDWKVTLKQHQFAPWQLDTTVVDRSVRVLPGVRKLLSSIPRDRYAITTSSTKTYAYGCLTLAGMIPPEVTITSDDKRVKASTPAAPEPYLRAAQDLGFDPECSAVFAASPYGIRAGIASGATVIAVCTSHTRAEIAHCGAHLVVDTLEQVHVVAENDHLKFVIEQHA